MGLMYFKYMKFHGTIFTDALRSEMKEQIGADIVDRIVCDLEDGFEVYTYIQGDLDFDLKDALERKYGTDAALPNVLTIMLLSEIYNTPEENIRLHADHKQKSSCRGIRETIRSMNTDGFVYEKGPDRGHLSFFALQLRLSRMIFKFT
ncbi:hypothetical protein GCM10020331_050660 [Ectobacillus funiculus]